MKNIFEILNDFGVEVPEEKKSDITKSVAENYKTIVEHEKKVSKLESERDNYKSQAETQAETLKSFEGKDYDAIMNEVDALKSELEKKDKEYADQLYERDFNDALEKEMANLKFTSASAKNSIENELKNSGLKLSNGKILGFNDFISQIKERDASAFVDEQQEELENKKPKFTEQIKNQNNQVTKESIMAIKDRAERQKAMLENKSLFGIE